MDKSTEQLFNFDDDDDPDAEPEVTMSTGEFMGHNARRLALVGLTTLASGATTTVAVLALSPFDSLVATGVFAFAAGIAVSAAWLWLGLIWLFQQFAADFDDL